MENHIHSYVLMPNSIENVILQFNKQTGEKVRESRYLLIEKCLTDLKTKISALQHSDEKVFHLLQDCICRYNPRLRNNGNFNILEDLCAFYSGEKDDKDVEMDAASDFCLRSFISQMVDKALELKKLFPEPIKLLQKNVGGDVSLTQEMASCLLANAFFCTFPKRVRPQGDFSNYPRINFNELYDDSTNMGSSWRAKERNAKLEKLKCLINYFDRSFRIVENKNQLKSPNLIVYERKVLQSEENLIELWKDRNLLKLRVKNSAQSIQSTKGTLQLDFANKFVGGGTLGNGSAMEEIRFITCPELIVAQLFVERLDDHESLLVSGFEQFSEHRGYGSSFEFVGNYIDTDTGNNQLVALDALRFNRGSLLEQLKKENIDRELKKCLCGFNSDNKTVPVPRLPIVSSGKWGCGVFNGDPELKCLIQWMAASVCDKTLELYTMGDSGLSEKLLCVDEVASEMGTSVGDLYVAVLKYAKLCNASPSLPLLGLIEFVINEMSHMTPDINETQPLSASDTKAREPDSTTQNFDTNSQTIRNNDEGSNVDAKSSSTEDLVHKQPSSWFMSTWFCCKIYAERWIGEIMSIIRFCLDEVYFDRQAAIADRKGDEGEFSADEDEDEL